MEKRVVLNLGYGNLATGFPAVTARLWEPENSHPMQFTGALPAAPEISQLYRDWQILYRAMHHRLNWRPRIEIEAADVTNVSEVQFEELCQRLALHINSWLNAAEFRPIDQPLRTYLETTDEICLVVETDDLLLQRLPWHLWHFFNVYPHAEATLSPSSYQRVSRVPVNTAGDLPTEGLRHRIKILVVLGNSEGIDVARDRTYLSQLASQAEIKVLAEPSLEDLTHELWQGCDLFFFAGHSSSQAQGTLRLNAEQQLTIDQLRYALQGAIASGLKLTIFNSCDGLALARSLADLSIPQVIVMREPVPDRVAQAFLKHFLTAFTQGCSLYRSVRAAREHLQGLEAEYPCASWLPAIYQNPAEAPATWQQWQADKQGTLPPVPIRRHALSKSLRTIGLASLLVTGLIMGIRYLGWLQSWELQAFDQTMRLRPQEEPDPRLLIVEVTEADLSLPEQAQRKDSISELALEQLLQKLDDLEPQAVGLDIYREDPTTRATLARRFGQQKNLYAICKASDDSVPDSGIAPPKEIPIDRQGFSDFTKDSNNVLRRHLIAMGSPNPPCTATYAISSLLALHYLESKGIFAEWTPDNALKIGDVLLRPLQLHSGGYQTADTQGLQILLNYRNTRSPLDIAPTVTLAEVLNDSIAKEQLQNRIVLIGVTGRPGDFHTTPYSSESLPNLPGVVIQAHMLSQIVSAVEDDRPLLSTWPYAQEILWIWIWAAVGGGLGWYYRLRLPLVLAGGSALGALYLCCFWLLIQGSWVPLIPAAVALLIAGGATRSYRLFSLRDAPSSRLRSSAPNSPRMNKP